MCFGISTFADLIPQELGSLLSAAPFRRHQLPQVILTPSFFPRGRHLSSVDTWLLVIRYGCCRFSASGKSTDLDRDRTCNLGYRRPVTNQLCPPPPAGYSISLCFTGHLFL
ncbi:hypothetical protein TNCV_4954601 [Trichonephila clavipes]|nr:hypothetical protein TNCV_4954601 [Trichonephila clavipes]